MVPQFSAAETTRATLVVPFFASVPARGEAGPDGGVVAVRADARVVLCRPLREIAVVLDADASVFSKFASGREGEAAVFLRVIKASARLC